VYDSDEGAEWTRRNIIVADSHRKIEAKMWGTLAKEVFEVGTLVRLTSMYVDVHRGQTRVSSEDCTVYEVQRIFYFTKFQNILYRID